MIKHPVQVEKSAKLLLFLAIYLTSSKRKRKLKHNLINFMNTNVKEEDEQRQITFTYVDIVNW